MRMEEKLTLKTINMIGKIFQQKEWKRFNVHFKIWMEYGKWIEYELIGKAFWI